MRNLHASFNMNSCLFRLKTVTAMHHWSEKQRFAVGVLCVTHALFVFFPPLNKILMRRRLFSLMWPTDAGQINNDHFSLVKAAGRGPFVYSACDIKTCNHISAEWYRTLYGVNNETPLVHITLWEITISYMLTCPSRSLLYYYSQHGGVMEVAHWRLVLVFHMAHSLNATMLPLLFG